MQRGGAERVITTLSNEFVKKNEVYIVSLLNEELQYYIDNRIKINTIDKKSYTKTNKINKILMKLNLNRIIKLKKTIIDINPDIIISFLPEPSLRLMMVRKFNKTIKNIPIIISIRNDPNKEYKNKIIYNVMKWLYKDVNSLVLQTTDAKKFFENVISKDKLTIISNPINQDFISNSPYNIIKEKNIINVGRLTEQKNQKLLINAFNKFIQIYPDYTLEIYGIGELKDELEQQIIEMNLKNKVFLKGQEKNIKEKMLKASMFVLSSNYEGMPNALMEAMALGVPCVSTDCPCGGPKHLIKQKENGLLVEVNNIDQLVEAMILLINDKELTKKISYNCIKIGQLYKLENIIKLWNDLICKTIQNKSNID